MTEAEQAELNELRALTGKLRASFSTRHLKPLEERLAWLDARIAKMTALGKIPTWDLQEASALRHAVAFMRAISVGMPHHGSKYRAPQTGGVGLASGETSG